MPNDDKISHGSCLCGGVRYRVEGNLRGIFGCHCQQCRKMTGHFMAATAAANEDFHLEQSDTLQWYRASDTARRGFCSTCGSTLFWHGDRLDYISIAAGTLDGETGLTFTGHVFCDDKGDYYDIGDDVPHYPQSSRA